MPPALQNDFKKLNSELKVCGLKFHLRDGEKVSGEGQSEKSSEKMKQARAYGRWKEMEVLKW